MAPRASDKRVRSARLSTWRDFFWGELDAAAVMTSLATYALAYTMIFGAGIWYLLGLVRKGPQPFEEPPRTEGGDKTPARPLSVGEREHASTEPASTAPAGTAPTRTEGP